mgnify:CR=1 FL=1
MHPFIQQLIELYDAEGYNTYGEGINQIEHGVQCAELALRAGESAELITSALLHDVGHLMAATDIAFGNYKHDTIGAEFLAPHFPPAVTEPIRLHAQAKRFLCAVEKGYLEDLSAASLDSLHHQGGLMTEEEQQDFLNEPYADDALKLRRWDDEGKVEELSNKGVADYLEYMTQALTSQPEEQVMTMDKEGFRQSGYVVLGQGLKPTEMELLEQSSQRLYKRAEDILAELTESSESLSDYYQRNQYELIVVPEIDDPLKVCRYECIEGTDADIREQIVPKLKGYIEQLTGTQFTLFKDKCNAKNPGGGAFEPHQDVIAYDQFKPQYHVTAAIFLDDATLENGCLNFPADYLQDLTGLDSESRDTPVGPRPILASYDGGPDNGNIQREISDKINWSPIIARRGDVVLFDSYVPHYSEKNESHKTRRAMFFTFNVLADGDHYQAYYAMKRNEFDNPKFHIATPTAHSKLAV